jgi:hypothetical protein
MPSRRREGVLLVAFHPIHEVGAGAGEADHGPADHAFVATVDRVAEEPFLGVLQQQVEEYLRWYRVKMCRDFTAARFQATQHIVSGSAVLRSKSFAVERLRPGIRRGDTQAIDLLGHQFALPAHLRWSIGIKRALHKPQGAAGVRRVHLTVDVLRRAGFQGSGALGIGRDQTLDGSVDKRPFLGSEIAWLVGFFAGRWLSRRSLGRRRCRHQHRTAKAGAGNRDHRDQGQGFA